MVRALSVNLRQLVYMIDKFPVIHTALWITMLMKQPVGAFQQKE